MAPLQLLRVISVICEIPPYFTKLTKELIVEHTFSGGKKYLIISVLFYTVGYIYILTNTSHSNLALFTFLSLYFIVLPGFYIHWVMRPQKSSWYKIFLIFFIGTLAVKISFPNSITNYFEDFSTLRAVILLIIITMNIRMFFNIFKNISGIRKSKNDPRFEIAIDKNRKSVQQQKIEMLIASEMVNWYYFLGKYPSSNRKYYLISKSRNAWILWSILFFIGISSLYCFWILYSYSILIATFSSLFILYSIPMLVANYRMAKYESIYIKGDYLVINYAAWAITAISVIHISNIKLISARGCSQLRDSQRG